jgi:hypothetical protein
MLHTDYPAVLDIVPPDPENGSIVETHINTGHVLGIMSVLLDLMHKVDLIC